jgi:hypothetical protein
METDIKKAETQLTTAMSGLRAWEGNIFESRDPQSALVNLRHAISQADKALQEVVANPKADVLEIRHLVTMRDLADGTLKAFERRRPTVPQQRKG